MIPLTVAIPQTAITDPAATVEFFSNIDARGIASGSPATSMGGRIPLFPSGVLADSAEWLNRAWLAGGWLLALSPAAVTLTTPPVCFGPVRITARAYDGVGNAQAGAAAEVDQFVNSTPMPPTGLERGAFADGQQSFSFSESQQLRVA